MTRLRGFRFIPWVLVAVVVGGAGRLAGDCGPFTDFSDPAFCPFVQEIFYLGITTGTSPTTYDPTGTVSRLQMAAFLSRTVDAVLQRSSRKAAIGRFWITQNAAALAITTVGNGAGIPASDGWDVWVPNSASGTVTRVRGSDGRVVETWDNAIGAAVAASAMGGIFAAGTDSGNGSFYRIDPAQPAGSVTTLAWTLASFPHGLTFDGGRFWIAASGGGGAVSIVTPGVSIPWTVTAIAGFPNGAGAVFDGANVWVTAGKLFKLDSSGAILQTMTVGSLPNLPVYDGGNIWVPNINSNSISVVRASSGTLLATLTGNGMSSPYAAAFDGGRILVTNTANDSVSLWKAADLTPIANVVVASGATTIGACSDGTNFWVTIRGNQLARF